MDGTSLLEAMILCPAEYLHFGGDKAEDRRQKAEGRRQKAKGKEEGCKVKGNDGC